MPYRPQSGTSPTATDRSYLLEGTPAVSSPLKQTITDNASGPKRVEGEDVTVEQHPLRDQIAADKHVSAQDGVSKKHRGLRFSKFSPPGAREMG